MTQHNHIGLLTTAKHFHKSAEKLNTGPQQLDASLPVYYLFLHAVELALKSYLCFRGVDEEGLRKIGHNLEAAWQQAMDEGICKLCSDCLEVQECIRIIGPIYRGDQLEYFYPGGTRLPVAERIHNSSTHIVTVLDEYYSQELAKVTAAIRDYHDSPASAGQGRLSI
ncbi:MAG: hypothetical protein V7754_02800 [Halioglobus sp.]